MLYIHAIENCVINSSRYTAKLFCNAYYIKNYMRAERKSDPFVVPGRLKNMVRPIPFLRSQFTTYVVYLEPFTTFTYNRVCHPLSLLALGGSNMATVEFLAIFSPR
jgi:hypothetical protein